MTMHMDRIEMREKLKERLPRFSLPVKPRRQESACRRKDCEV